MNRGFYIIMAAQFFSSLADNALLIAAISMLRDIKSPPQYEPLLKLFSPSPMWPWPPSSAPLPTPSQRGG